MQGYELKDIKNIFAKNGYHFTEQRKFICKELLKSKKDYMSCSEIYEYLKTKNSSLSLATVYRAVDSLEKMGLLKKTIIENKIIKYKICFDCEKKVYSHLICEECGKIIQFESECLENLIQDIVEDGNFSIKNQIINFNGLCAECLKKNLEITKFFFDQ